MLKNQNFHSIYYSFFVRHFSFLIKSFINILRKHYLAYILLWGFLVSLSCLAHYIAYADQFLIFSLILPLALSVFSTFLVASFSLFVLPYWVQKQLNMQGLYEREIPLKLISFCKKFPYWFREMVKVVSVSYLWAILLVLPGVWKFLKCAFVSYITLLSERSLSPRKTSYQYTKGNMKYISSLFFIFFGGIIILNFSFPHLYSLNGQMVVKFMVESFWFLFASSFMSIGFHLIYLEEEEKSKPSFSDIPLELSI